MIDPWPTDDDMAELCGGPTAHDQLVTGGCAHTLGRHHYGDDMAPCEVPDCGCTHFR